MNRTTEELLPGVTEAAHWYMALRAEATPPTPPAATTPPAPEPAKPAEGDPPKPAEEPAAPAAGGEDDDDPTKWDKDRAAQTIKHLRGREKTLAQEAKAEKDRADALEREKMSEEERKEADRKAADERATAAEQRAREAELLGTLAARDDVADAEIARDLLIARGLKFGEDGKPLELDTAVSSLLEAKPVLKKESGEVPAPGDGDGSGGSATPPNPNGAAGSGGQGSPPQLNADEVKAANDAGMSHERYAELKKGRTSLSEWEAQQKKEKEKEAATT